MERSNLSPADDDRLSELVENTLNSLCIPPSLLGYPYLVYAIALVASDPMCIKTLGKRVYQEAAQLYGTDQRAVERDVRTAIQACWNCGGRETLDKMACRHLVQRPWATEFIAIVAQHVKRKYRR